MELREVASTQRLAGNNPPAVAPYCFDSGREIKRENFAIQNLLIEVQPLSGTLIF